MKSKTIASLVFCAGIVTIGAVQFTNLTTGEVFNSSTFTNTCTVDSRPKYFFEEHPTCAISNNLEGCRWYWRWGTTNPLCVTFEWLLETNTPRRFGSQHSMWAEYLTNSFVAATNPAWGMLQEFAVPKPERGEDSFTVYSNLQMRVDYKGGSEAIWLESIPVLSYKRKWSMQKVYEK